MRTRIISRSDGLGRKTRAMNAQPYVRGPHTCQGWNLVSVSRFFPSLNGTGKKALSYDCQLVPGKEPQVTAAGEDSPVYRRLSQEEGGGEAGSASGQCLVSGRPLPLPTTKEITATGGEWSTGKGPAKVPRGWGGRVRRIRKQQVELGQLQLSRVTSPD